MAIDVLVGANTYLTVRFLAVIGLRVSQVTSVRNRTSLLRRSGSYIYLLGTHDMYVRFQQESSRHSRQVMSSRWTCLVPFFVLPHPGQLTRRLRCPMQSRHP